MKKTMCLLLSALMILGISSCNMNNTAKGGLLGGGGGAAIGAGIGALIGKGKGAAIGAAIGAVAGGTAGALIGRKMDKQAKELAQINGAQVDTVTDVNNLTAIKVTFDSGILFDFNKSNLSASAKNSLSQFAASLQNNPQTDVQIYGHTDNVGTRAANERCQPNAPRKYANTWSTRVFPTAASPAKALPTTTPWPATTLKPDAPRTVAWKSTSAPTTL